jgi:uncharacterized protein (UPF0276 family)
MVSGKHTVPEVRGSIPDSAGIGLRTAHQWQLLTELPSLAFLEVHSENYFSGGGAHLEALTKLRETYPLSVHGVGLSLGSTDPLDGNHLTKLKTLIDRFEPALISEHLSWSSVGGRFVNDLLPLPYTSEALRLMVDRVDEVQTSLGRRMLIENISAYVNFARSDMSEAEFLNQLSQSTGCGILLDVNNLYVNQLNHGTDARATITAIDPRHVGEIHLAGHSRQQMADREVVIDTHSAPVTEEVWRLLDFALVKMGARPTLIEWDADLPLLTILLEEASIADSHLKRHHAVAA